MKTLKRILKDKYEIKSIGMDVVLIRLNGTDDIEIEPSINRKYFNVYVWKNERICKEHFRVKENDLIPMLNDLIALYGSGYYNRSYNEMTTFNAWYKDGKQDVKTR
jgi:hypothetical protein